jgi:peptide/nickel transport system permease protein
MTGPVLPTIEPPPPGAVPVATTSAKKIARRETIRLLLHRPEFLIGVGVTLFWVICAIGGERLAPHDPYAGNPLFSHSPPGADGWSFVLGTDRLGRDVLSRIIVGSQDVLVAAPAAAVIGVALGTLLGLVMGYYRGLVDDVLSRFVEAFLALPVTLVVGLLFAPIVARTVRAAVLAERELDYVQAARLRGENGPVIMSREILPNITGPIVVELTVRIGYAIFTISTLSFLGVGIQPPSPDWGLQISEEYSMIINGYWWTVFFPSLAIASLVIAANLIADALQAVLQR